MPRILFVTNELYPIARGGIGRLIHNYAVWNAAQPEPAEIHILMLGLSDARRWGDDPMPPVVIHDADRLGALKTDQENWLGTCRSAAYAELVRPSIRAANAVEALYEQEDLLFDWIEFPDFMGLAADSLRRRLAGAPALGSARISVRLHSSMTLIQADEGPGHHPSDWFAAVTDLERYALRHADLVVGHLHSIVELNRRRFGFGQDWARRVHVEFPPIFLTPSEEAARIEAAEERPAGAPQTFVFSSRLQPFKRPELFIRGAVAFARRRPERHDRFLLVSYGWDAAYQAWLHSLIPADLAERIEILSGLGSDERARIMADAVIVCPSTFESLCLLAYESHLYGRRLILNEIAEAFGDAPFWEDERTCLLFDGTPEGLAGAMERALDFQPETDRPLPETSPYWTAPPPRPRPQGQGGLDLVLTEVASTSERLEAAFATAADGPWSRAFLFRDRLFDDSAPAREAPDGVMPLDAYGAGVGRAELAAALRRSRAEHVLLAPFGFAPTCAWVDALERLLSSGADLLAFPEKDSLGRPRRLPLLDCPNLAAEGFEPADGAVILRRRTALSLLERVGADDDWAVPRLVLAAALSGAAAHVPDLPVISGRARAPHRHALSRHLADLLAAERRACMPHLAAYTGVSHSLPESLPHHDEFAAVPRPGPVPDPASAEPDLMEVSGRMAPEAGIRAERVLLRRRSATETRWQAEILLPGLSIEGEPVDLLHCAVAQTASGLEVAFRDGGGAVRIASRAGGFPSECDPRTAEGRRRLRLLAFVAERVPLWHAESLRGLGIMPPPRFEEELRAEAERLVHFAAIGLDFLEQGELTP